MFGSAILDVLIGLVTIFLLLSLCATAIREGIEGFFKTRAVMLERGIRELFDDHSDGGLVRRLYEHPVIYGLYRGRYEPKLKRFVGDDLPTYIPSKSFSTALIDIALRGQHAGPYASAHTSPVLTVDELRRAVGRLPGQRLRHVMLTAIDDAQGDLDAVRTNLETWFDSSMDRVSGWYKRHTQLWLFGIGVALAGSLNVNTIAIANHLWSDKPARDALVQRAEQLRTDTTYERLVRDSTRTAARTTTAAQDLESLDLPIGWDHLPPRPAGTSTFNYVFLIVVGILVTSLAVTLGAPFWFDTLNRIMIIRSTVKPHEKSPEEGSQDRPAASEPVRVAVERPAAPPVAQPAAAAPAVAGAPRAAPAIAPVPTPPVEFTPQEWATGHPDEGLL